MCGIFGFIHIDAKNQNNLKDQINDLFILTEPRGKQASGLSIQTNNSISTYKRPEKSSKVIKSKSYNDFLDSILLTRSNTISILGHCRLVTDGSEINNVHNQPINLEKIVGVHNGVINNFERIKEKYNITPKGNSDSEIVFHCLENGLIRDENPVDSIKNFYKEMRGAASLGLLFSDFQQQVISTNFGSLYYAFTENNSFIFASEEKILKVFFKKHKLKGSIVKLKPDTGLSIDINNLNKFEFNLFDNKPHNFPFSRASFEIIDLSPSPKNIKRCTKCILPINYPFLKLDKDGVCNICNKYITQKFKGKDNLHRYLDKFRSKTGDVDCLIGLSGGRDSSYGLHVLKEEFGMNPVGFAYDWLLTSRKARHNIAKMAGALNVEVIYRCGDYETQAKNIRDNIDGFLKDPDLGMMTFVQAGDKEMYHYGREIRKDKKLDLTVWCSGYQLEQREFFVGYCGIDKTLVNNPRLYNYGWMTKLRLAVYYGLKTLRNPSYWNRSIYDNGMAFWHCFVAKDDFLYLFDYYPWVESEVEGTLKDKYKWEADTDYGQNQWRMDDFHTSFINYVYYTVGGFSEFDDFRSNQIREGLITRDDALRLAAIDNNIRYESLREFSNLVGFNLEHALKKIDAIPKLYI